MYTMINETSGSTEAKKYGGWLFKTKSEIFFGRQFVTPYIPAKTNLVHRNY